MGSKYKGSIDFGVIGLGRFGSALAESLANKGMEVLALDSDPERVENVQDYVEHAYVIEHFDRKTLEEAGVQNCQTVIICISDGSEKSILTTLNVIDLGVPRVFAKATSQDHGCVLQRIGAQVVFPEKDMALKLANTLVDSSILDYIRLCDDYSIAEIKVTKKYSQKSIFEGNFRKKYHLNIIGVVKDKQTIIEITPDIVLNENDLIVVIGRNENISKFEKIMNED